MSTTEILHSATESLIRGEALAGDELHLALGECHIRVRSNSAELIEQLRGYFAHTVGPPAEATLEILAIESAEPDLGIEFIDWQREPGKSGRKDSYYDLPGARLVRKVRTGMVFLQSEQMRIAAGPCRRYDNQVINFINAQYMNWLQNRDWHICHAAGLTHDGRCLGIAGFSGGGKSTLMLHLLEKEAVNYLTNDRLFIRPEGDHIDAVGIPKLPRVNPGTIVHNPRLHPLIPAEQREKLLKLPAEELWHLEEKYDVLVEEVYGAGRITPHAPLAAFLILNWTRDSEEPVSVERFDPKQRPELLGAIMKSPGPFYQFPDGTFLRDDVPLDPAPYIEALEGVPLYEARGGVDFPALERIVLDELLEG